MIARFGVVITDVLRESLRHKLWLGVDAPAGCCGRRQRGRGTQRRWRGQVRASPGAPESLTPPAPVLRPRALRGCRCRLQTRVGIPGDLDLVGGSLVGAPWSGHSDPVARRTGEGCRSRSRQRCACVAATPMSPRVSPRSSERRALVRSVLLSAAVN